jgi:hypothetical protein
VLTAVAVVALAAGCGGQRDDDRTYVARNVRILASLPVYPPAEAIAPAETCRHDGGYETSIRYRVPAGTDARVVIEFYESRLRAWEAQVSPPQRPKTSYGVRLDVWSALFTRGAESVYVDAGLLQPQNAAALGWSYRVVVDAEGADHVETC